MVQKITGTISNVIDGAQNWEIKFNGGLVGKPKHLFQLFIGKDSGIISNHVVRDVITRIDVGNKSEIITKSGIGIFTNDIASMQELALTVAKRKIPDRSTIEKKVEDMKKLFNGKEIFILVSPNGNAYPTKSLPGTQIDILLHN